jgi:poly(3-hydroxybutyrate) depolymerase
MATPCRIRPCLLRASLVAALGAALATIASPAQLQAGIPPELSVRYRGDVSEYRLHYEANGGHRRIVFVLLPRWYGPGRHPRLPLIIAPHGRGAGPFLEQGRAWGQLPAKAGFVVLMPEGQGRMLAHHSWGYRGQVDDLARMPAILRESIPWLRVDAHRIYAVGGSMGGQETLLLAAQHPGLLAGAVTFDAPTDLARRYQQVVTLPNAGSLRALMRLEVGGTPDELPEAYADRSPLHFAQALADSGVPLEMWWSTRDELVVNQRTQCGRLFAELKRLNPRARVVSVVGTWPHVAELRWDRGLPRALHFLGVPHAE